MNILKQIRISSVTEIR